MSVIAIAAVLALPATGTAKLLDDYYNEGIEPHADLGEPSRSAKHPHQIKVEFSGNAPVEVINARFTVKCYRGKKTRFSRRRSLSGPSLLISVVPIKGRFDSCRVTYGEARYASPFISGWLRIRVFGS